MANKRKGMDAAVLGLALGVVVLLVVLAVIVGLNTSGSFKDFLAKVPWLNKIVPPEDTGGGSGGGGAGGSFAGECTGPCLGLPSGNVLRFVAVTAAAGGNNLYMKISDGKPQEVPAGVTDTGPYQFGVGDTLEYDVYLPLNQPCTGGITIETSAGSMDNDNSWKDNKGLVGTLKNCNPDPVKVVTDSDMTPYAYRKWYHRVINIPAALNGKTLNKISLVMSGQTYDSKNGGVVYIAFYDNIVIRSSKGVYKFFENSNPPFMEKEKCGTMDSCRYDRDKYAAFVAPVAYLPSDATQPQNNIINTAAGEVLKLSSTGSGKWMYLKAFELAAPAPYTVKPGDIVEYDININTCEKEVGGIDLRSKAGPNKWKDLQYWRNIYDWKFHVWTKGTPDDSEMDLTNLACNKWYHRIIPAPPDMWVKTGKPVEIIDLVIGYNAAAGKTVTAYYDNLQITDGTGAVKVFYPECKVGDTTPCGVPILPLHQFDETEGGGGADGNYKTSTVLSKIPSPP